MENVISNEKSRRDPLQVGQTSRLASRAPGSASNKFKFRPVGMGNLEACLLVLDISRATGRGGQRIENQGQERQEAHRATVALNTRCHILLFRRLESRDRPESG